jgi:hypothetical protein
MTTPGPQPGPFNMAPLTIPGPQPGPVPMLTVEDRLTCQTCGGADLTNTLGRQRDELQKSIDLERQQSTAKTVKQQASQIEQFKQQESQSSQTRNIEQEIAQKLQLLSAIDAELQQSQSSQSSQNTSQSSQTVQQSSQAIQNVETPPPAPSPGPQTRVCMLCQTVEDAIRFQAGESVAGCSVDSVTMV